MNQRMRKISDRLKHTATQTAHSKKARWLIGGLITLLLLLTFAVPPLLRSSAIEQLQQTLGRPVVIESIQINPLTLSATVNGFAIQQPDGKDTLIGFKRLHINLELLSLFHGGPVLREIRIEQPQINIARLDANRFDFSDILDRLAKKDQAKEDKQGTQRLFSLNNIQLIGGSIQFDDRPLHTRHRIQDIQIDIPFLSNLPYQLDDYVKPRFAAVINGTALELKGRTKPFSESLRTEFELQLKQLDIPHYLAYLPAKFHFSIPSGVLDAKATLSFVQYPQADQRAPEVLISAQASAARLVVNDAHAKPVFKLAKAQASLSEGNIAAKHFVLNSIVLDQPELFVIRDRRGVINLTQLVDKDEEESTTTVDIARLQLNNGTIEYNDHATRPSFSTRLQAIQLTLSEFSTAADKISRLELLLRTNAGETIGHKGEFTVKPSFKASGQLSANALQLKRYAPYYQKGLNFHITDGSLDINSHYQFAVNGNTTLDNLGITLRQLTLRQPGQRNPLLTLPSLAISESTLDLNQYHLVIGQLTSKGARLVAQRNSQGEINLTQLTTPTTTATPPAVTPGWRIDINQLGLHDYAVEWLDQHLPQPAKLSASAISLSATGLSTATGAKGKANLSLTLNKHGKLQASGPLAINPFATTLAMQLKGIELMPLQPYFTDKLNIIVTSGAVSGQGRLNLSTAHGLKLGFSGNTGLTHLATQDKTNLAPLINWNALFINGIDFNLEPLSVNIKEVALSDFYSRVQIDDHGRINLQDILVKTETATGAAGQTSGAGSASAPSTPITIDRVTLQGGTIDFSDHFIKPNYSANLTAMTGRVTGLSSNPEARADLDLRGKLENLAPLEIRGKINPLGSELFADLHAKVDGFDLSPLTPYSGKFAGYTIEKGKLSLDLNYLIEQGKLRAQNKVFLDQFNFGNAVESPDAINLPLNLAVALLKNRNGEIDLKLPIEGTLSDPEFRFGQVIWQVVKNLVVKIVTSPFALLGSLVGGGEEMSYVVFDEGSEAIPEAASSKLANLEKALYERPALKLEIVGHIDPERDTIGLRQQQFLLKLKRQKFKRLAANERAITSLEEIQITPEEYPDYLKLAYQNESFPKPRTVIGTAKNLPQEEMEKLMNSYITISEEDLRTLALTRATMVMAKLLESGKVETSRVFLIEPKTLAPEAKDGVKNSRVNFAIK